MPENKPWWGDFSFNAGQSRCWSMAERHIVIQRQVSEWSCWNIETLEENSEPLRVGEGPMNDTLDPKVLNRHLQSKTTDTLRVVPALADRPVVTRPSSPLHLLGGERTTLYVSTPLWFQALVTPTGSLVLDIPFWRPSDSWFGPSTLEGEFCYAKYTDARLQLNNLEHRPHRALTPVQVINKGNGALLIERLNVPVPLLSIYRDHHQQLWTQTLTVTREADGDMAKLHLEKKPPEHAESSILVCEPRIKTEKHTVIRTIGSLFS